MKRPNQYLSNPKQFGKKLNPEWKHSSKSNVSEIEAAKIQNECSFEMHQAILAKYGSVVRYCRMTGQDYQRVGRLLRGDAQLKSEDLGRAVVNLGISVRFISKFAAFANKREFLVAAESPNRNEMGAFYTPDAIADYMLNRIVDSDKRTMLEPSFGDGAFIKAALKYSIAPDNITGVELDKAACNVVLGSELGSKCQIENKNFFDFSTRNKFDLVIGNPPYVRIRKLKGEDRNKAFSLNKIKGIPNYGEEASLWMPFTIKCVNHLNDNGNLALVLPFEITYVRYSREIWKYLSEHFKHIEVIRIHDRVFGDLMQDVVLLLCFKRGGKCDCVHYICADSLMSLKNGNPIANAEVNINQILNGTRAFQHAMIPSSLLRTLYETDSIIRAGEEAAFHIGYVCGNKDFFHPKSEDIKRWGLPKSSLIDTAVSTKSIKNLALWTSHSDAPDTLWLPKSKITDEEIHYISHGEENGFHETYKCRRRNPWWKVPAVKTPNVILSVFSDTPKLLINDAEWSFSNSLLGGYLKTGVDCRAFVRSWYTAITLLSIELEVHSLGGGVLVVVPREANRIHKFDSTVIELDKSDKSLSLISNMLMENDIDGAYHIGDDLLEQNFGKEFVHQVWQSISVLRSWRKR